LDKFGIFKFFSSFFDLLNKNNSQNLNASSNEQADNALSGIESFFNAIKDKNSKNDCSNSSLGNPIKTDSSSANSFSKSDSFGDKTKNQPSVSAPVRPPLNYQMLSTMRSHDEFIKRVKEKNKTL